MMGILNVTPDSFYDGGQYEQKATMQQQVDKMVEEGAAIIDVGGMSSRPGADIISETEELARVIPAIDYIAKVHGDVSISIDTLHSEVAKQAIDHGASIINDISGGDHDPQMIAVAAEHGVPYVMMHMQGEPSTMQDSPSYEDVVLDVLSAFARKVRTCRAAGVKDIIVDPGFGFGKTIEHNYQLLRQLSVFKILDCPVLAGLSRKSMIYKPLGISPAKSLSGTSALHMVALGNGVKILRAHDVATAVQVVKLHQLYHG